MAEIIDLASQHKCARAVPVSGFLYRIVLQRLLFGRRK
jgi:hypothetical protein